MQWIVPALVVAASGCNLVYGLDETRLVDAGTIDVPDAPPPRCPSGNTPIRGVFQAVADAGIFSSSPDQPAGGLAVATIGTDLGPAGSRGLFRFRIDGVDSATVLDLRLVLPSAERSDDCVPNCGVCMPIERAGAMLAYPVRSDWVETEVTWNRASAGRAWQLPGADGASDRGPALGDETAHVVGADTVFVADSARFPDIFGFRLGDDLSFVVSSTAAKQVVRSRENTCDGGASNARLEIFSCP